eukprot:TRINITY_DN77031_c0_g1_i1.p1 TRINITY_DN77031_c0_g1~~TRINITY_DN77031_c0_g1_i1.p1  ORF type:complete len:605 (+),score=120.80 TRINITY_DN77031_c0_g1_i1:260-2074(+)
MGAFRSGRSPQRHAASQLFVFSLVQVVAASVLLLCNVLELWTPQHALVVPTLHPSLARRQSQLFAVQRRCSNHAGEGLGTVGNPGALALSLLDELIGNPDQLADTFSFLEGRLPREKTINALVRIREAARQQRKFEVADALRDQLVKNKGLDLEDRADGSHLRNHTAATVARAAAAAKEGAAARAIARKAVERSLAADSGDEALAAAHEAARGVRERLASPGAEGALRGRQAADLALSLALAGCDDCKLFAELALKAKTELERTAHRAPVLTVAQIAERCAAAGFRQDDFPDLFEAARGALQKLRFSPSSPTMCDLTAGNFSLHSQRPLLWLFRHALQQGRRCLPPADASLQASAAVASLNCRGEQAPLIVDLGCGFGVSSLGLASGGQSVLAVDASAHCIGYAQALAKRWKIPPELLQLRHCSAQQALETVAREYHGPVEWILINFPTPFAEVKEFEHFRDREDCQRSGNSQLPLSVQSADFMGNAALLKAAHACLVARGGALLVQSNVEDLAVMLRSMAEEDGWEAVVDGSFGPEVESVDASEQPWVSRRLLRHKRRGGLRAQGPGWLSSSPLPRLASTETEAYYMGEDLPIHRIALRPRRE